MTSSTAPQDKHGLLSAPINRVLPAMTIPMIFGLVAILLFNLVDTFFVARLGTDALAAISFTFPVTFAVNCITMGIGVGLASLIGRQLGKGDLSAAARLTTHGLLLAVILVALTTLVGYHTIEPLFTLLGASLELLPMIRDYMEVWYLTIPLLVIPMAGNSAIRAGGDTKTPAKIMMLAGIINGILDPLLIFGLGPFPEWGIRGAAIASGISWAGALVGSGWVLIKRERLLGKPNRQMLGSDWRQILSIGTPAGLSNAMNPLSGALLMVILAQHGNAAVAAYGAAQRIESLLLIVIMALASIFTPFMAQNLGAKRFDRTRQGLLTALHFTLGFQLLIYILLVPITWPLTHFFIDDVQVQEALWLYLITVPASYGMQGMLMVLIATLNAMQKSTQAMLWTSLRLFGLMLPGALIASRYFDTEGIFISLAIANVVAGSGAYLHARYIRKQWQQCL
uniref:MATE family efflux transporter n=1 Tax=Thaumasiovibrio occultus TaxID=1891184 RepID=UPI000B35BE44|nr:MATE family efflux transporter [Thaumasiovibrio occultus]